MSNVRDFGAVGDGRHDDTAAVLHALEQGDGPLVFPRGDYRLTRTVRIELGRTGRIGIDGSSGTAKILMDGSGPAFHFVGTHDKTADPQGFRPQIWERERMPFIQAIEIEGRHPEAGGILLEGVMQPTLAGVLIRKVEHGIHVRQRARNVLISHCHVYDCRGVGVFFESLNLHQAIVSGSHISYCKRGGIKVVDSEIRNFQVTGNDIEYNYDLEADESADVWIDCSSERSSVREGTIASNTIQAKASPGGANVRIVGRNREVDHKAGLWTIVGNLIGSQEVNVHLLSCRGVTLSGNVIYSGHVRSLLIDASRNIVCGANCLSHNPDYQEKELCIGVRIVDSRDCTFQGAVLQDCQAGQHTVAGARPVIRHGLLEIERCQRINVSGCQILDASPHGVDVRESRQVLISGCTIVDSRSEKRMESAIRWQGTGEDNLATGNHLGAGTAAQPVVDPQSAVTWANNLSPSPVYRGA